MIRYSRAMTCLMTYYDKKRTEAISIMLQARYERIKPAENTIQMIESLL